MKLLVVVDMQKDFVDGALGSSEAQAIVDNVVEKVKAAKEAGDQVIFTMDTHETNYLETMEGTCKAAVGSAETRHRKRPCKSNSILR